MDSDTQNTANTALKGNTNFRARGWCFTWNNYHEVSTYLDTLELLKSMCRYYAFGFEVAPTTATRHIQGYVYFKNARTFDQMKLILPDVHLEKANRSPKDNHRYCSKGGVYESNMSFDENEYVLDVISELRPWQSELENIVRSPPNGRSIYWIWENVGNVGKTSFVKYLLNKYEFCEFSRATKSADIVTVADRKKTCYLFDFARTQENFSPYIALEQLKDGLVSDSKLKKTSRNIIMNCPHIICFANWAPNRAAMSLDRWKVYRIENGHMIADNISDADNDDIFRLES